MPRTYSRKRKTKKRNSQRKKKSTIKKVGQFIPNVEFMIRLRDESISGSNPYKWSTLHTNDFAKNKRIVIFSLPGAFTPTCTTSHLPDYEKYYNELCKYGIDDVYCLSVNDAFVMNQWGKQLGIQNVKLLPDGSAEFTKKMGALVKKDNLGFGKRSWRYAMVVNNGKIEKIFNEKGFSDNCTTDPFKASTVTHMLNYLKTKKY